jgi:hypothetical protein
MQLKYEYLIDKLSLECKRVEGVCEVCDYFNFCQPLIEGQ